MTILAAASSSGGLPTWAYIVVGVAVVVGPVATALVLLKKQPAETRKITVDTVDVNVKVAGELRDDAVEAWRLQKQATTDLRAEFEQYREDTEQRLLELAAELRGKVAENQHLRDEIGRRDRAIEHRDERIEHLEGEVAELKKKVARLENGGSDTPVGPHI